MDTKFLEEIIPKERKFNDYEIIALGEKCSIMVLHKLPTKFKDPGSFSIPCVIRYVSTDKALFDLSSSMSLILYLIFKLVDLGS